MIPFDDIRRLQNRSWSFPLVEMIERGEVEDADEICRTIGALEDPRLSGRLLQILEDFERPLIHLFNLEEFQVKEHASTYSKGTKSSEPSMTVDEIIADLGDSDACWADKLHKYNCNHDWSWLANDDAVRLVQFLAANEDVNLRELACSIAAHRKLSDLLFDLLNDPSSRVRKTASYHSRMLGSERRFGDRLWQILMSPDTRGFFATETLESYLVHVNDQSVDAQLKELALEDERPSVKAAAVSALHKRMARDEIDSVSCLLLLPAFNNWWVHRNVLDACAELRIAASIDHLLEEDDVYLQVAVAEYRVAMNGS